MKHMNHFLVMVAGAVITLVGSVVTFVSAGGAPEHAIYLADGGATAGVFFLLAAALYDNATDHPRQPAFAVGVALVAVTNAYALDPSPGTTALTAYVFVAHNVLVALIGVGLVYAATKAPAPAKEVTP